MNCVWNNVNFSIADIGGGISNTDIAPHSHAINGYELHFVLGGTGRLIIDGTTEYILKKDTFYVTGPQLLHEQKFEKDEYIEDVFIYIQTSERQNKNAVAESFLSTNFYITESFDMTLAKMIFNEYKSKNADYKTAIEGMTMALLSQITRQYLPKSTTYERQDENLYDKRFVIIENTLLYHDDITLSGLAKKAGVCTRQMERLLKKYYGKTFREMKKDRINLKENGAQTLRVKNNDKI